MRYFQGRLWEKKGPLCEKNCIICVYRISSNNSQGDYFFFHIKRERLFKGGDYSREVIISNTAHCKSCPKYFVLLFLKSKHYYIK